MLGVAIGVIPHVCKEILARDDRWRKMVEHVKTVPTQAFQLWLRDDMTRLGLDDGPLVNLPGFVEPFDTWADMTHVASREAWTDPPRSIAYFCNVLPGRSGPDVTEKRWEEDAEFLARRRHEVRDNAVRFMNGDLHHLWPKAHLGPGRFDWTRLLSTRSVASSESAFDTQFWTANVSPTDRYVSSLPGSRASDLAAGPHVRQPDARWRLDELWPEHRVRRSRHHVGSPSGPRDHAISKTFGYRRVRPSLTASEATMSARKRVKRPVSERAEPARSWTGAFQKLRARAGRARISGSGTRGRAGFRWLGGSPRRVDPYLEAVNGSYRVIDEYMRQGQRFAEEFWLPSGIDRRGP